MNTLFDPVCQPTGHLAFPHTAFQKACGWQGQKSSCCARSTGNILKPTASLQGGHGLPLGTKTCYHRQSSSFPLPETCLMFDQPCGKNIPNFALEFAWHSSLVTRGFCTLHWWLKACYTSGSRGWHALLNSAGLGLVVVKEICGTVMLENL